MSEVLQCSKHLSHLAVCGGRDAPQGGAGWAEAAQLRLHPQLWASRHMRKERQRAVLREKLVNVLETHICGVPKMTGEHFDCVEPCILDLTDNMLALQRDWIDCFQ